MKISRLALLVPLALIAAACGDDTVDPGDAGSGGAEEPVPSPVEIDGAWLLVSGEIDGAAVALVDGWDVTMDIDGDRIGGTAACNGYGGTVETGDDGSFAVGELSWTEMGCEPAVMELEQAFLQSLSGVTSYELADELLTIGGSTSTWSFEPLAPVPTADIVGTTWVLDTYLSGDAATNTPAMEDATLTLHDGGTLSGSTGCRALTGEWTESGAQIVVTSLSAIDDPAAGQCAPGWEELDNWVISVIEGGFSPTVEGNRLTILAQGNEGLSYTAR